MSALHLLHLHMFMYCLNHIRISDNVFMETVDPNSKCVDFEIIIFSGQGVIQRRCACDCGCVCVFRCMAICSICITGHLDFEQRLENVLYIYVYSLDISHSSVSLNALYLAGLLCIGR